MKLLREADVIAAIEAMQSAGVMYNDVQILSDAICATDAIAAIRALPDADQWQGIETAPRDGTRVVLVDANIGQAIDGKWFSDSNWINQPVLAGQLKPKACWFPLSTATHWQPLPAPPKKE